MCPSCAQRRRIPDHSSALQRTTPSCQSVSTSNSYAHLHDLGNRTENPGVGGSIPSLPTISLLILSVISATRSPSRNVSTPPDFVETLSFLTGTTTRRAPRCAFKNELEILVQIVDVRTVLEGWVAAQAAQRATPDRIRRIQSLARELRVANQRGDSKAMSDLDLAFHRAIMEAAQNSVVLHMMETLTVISSMKTFKNHMPWPEKLDNACRHDQIRLSA